CCRGDFPVVHSRCRKFLKHVHNLFTRGFWWPLASGLETRNHLRKRQEKNEFYFPFQQRNFLDCEYEARVWRENTKQRVAKSFARAKPRQIRTPCDEQTSVDCLRIPS